jgi:hypothetical protein
MYTMLFTFYFFYRTYASTNLFYIYSEGERRFLSYDTTENGKNIFLVYRKMPEIFESKVVDGRGNLIVSAIGNSLGNQVLDKSQASPYLINYHKHGRGNQVVTFAMIGDESFKMIINTKCMTPADGGRYIREQNCVIDDERRTQLFRLVPTRYESKIRRWVSENNKIRHSHHRTYPRTGTKGQKDGYPRSSETYVDQYGRCKEKRCSYPDATFLQKSKDYCPPDDASKHKHHGYAHYDDSSDSSHISTDCSLPWNYNTGDCGDIDQEFQSNMEKLKRMSPISFVL